MSTVDRQNIVAQFFNGVIRPLFRSADWLSSLLFICFCGLVLVALAFRLHLIQASDLGDIYEPNYWIFWYVAWFLLVISTVGPLIHAQQRKEHSPLFLLVSVSVFHLLAFLFISVAVLIIEKKDPSAVTALLAATAGAGMAGVGWVVQHHSSARAMRRAHTFNVLLQSRMSKEFQENVRSRELIFPMMGRVTEADAELFLRSGFEKKIDTLKEAEKKVSACQSCGPGELQKIKEAIESTQRKYEGMQALRYLMNFYEFLCAGIRNNDLDEGLLKETLSDIAVVLYDDVTSVRLKIQTQFPSAYENMDEIVGRRWKMTSRRR